MLEYGGNMATLQDATLNAAGPATDGLRLLTSAAGFASLADAGVAAWSSQVPRGSQVPIVCFTLAQAAELALKAYLLQRGIREASWQRESWPRTRKRLKRGARERDAGESTAGRILLGAAPALQQNGVHFPEQPIREWEALTQALQPVGHRNDVSGNLGDIGERHAWSLAELTSKKVRSAGVVRHAPAGDKRKCVVQIE